MIRDRRAHILAGLDLAHGIGAEIGALDRPLVHRTDGPVLYVDHADTATIRAKYATDGGVESNKLVDVDAVWGERTLVQSLGRGDLDYVVASHVVEHVPDLLGWLEEIREALKPTGQLRLAVPDRRFTFDCLREDSRVSDVLAAYVLRARRPTPQAILDCCLNVVRASAQDIWRGLTPLSSLERMYDLSGPMGLARDSLDNGAYHDVHCWVFTPYAMADIFLGLAERGLFHYRCAAFVDTPDESMEFFVGLEPCSSVSDIVRSWTAVKRDARQFLPNSRFRPVDAGPNPPGETAAGDAPPGHPMVTIRRLLADADEQRRLAHERMLHIMAIEPERDQARQQAAQARKDADERLAEVKRLRAELDDLRRSTSWRVTGPIRAVRALIG